MRVIIVGHLHSPPGEAECVELGVLRALLDHHPRRPAIPPLIGVLQPAHGLRKGQTALHDAEHAALRALHLVGERLNRRHVVVPANNPGGPYHA